MTRNFTPHGDIIHYACAITLSLCVVQGPNIIRVHIEYSQARKVSNCGQQGVLLSSKAPTKVLR